MTDFRALYHQAIDKTHEAKEARTALEQSPDDFIQAVKNSRAQLFSDLLAKAPEKILESAERGMSTADILKFNGNEALDDISILFLLKGQRKNAAPPPPGTPEPLFPEIQEALRPFEVVHDWDGISGGNRVIVRW